MDCLDYLKQRQSDWRFWLKVILTIVYVLAIAVMFPIMIWQLVRRDVKAHITAWFIAGVFVLLTLPIFLIGLVQHLTNYTRPDLQRHIIRILWMVPIYSLDSWLALLFPQRAIYFDTIREWYEAYVLYNFLAYLLNYLQAEYDLEKELTDQGRVKQPKPWCCIPIWPAGRVFIQRCKFGVLQYIVIRCLVTLTALITYECGAYHRGSVKLDDAYSYLAIITAISQVTAIHSLLYFYKATKQMLKPIKPLTKFLCIKAIVFFAIWQSIIISLILKIDAVKDSPVWKHYSIDNVQTGIQDLLICIEMLVAAIVHYFVFSHKPYVNPEAAQVPCLTSCWTTLDVRDVATDMKEQVNIIRTSVISKVRKITRAKSSSQEGAPHKQQGTVQDDTERNENTPLLRSSINEDRPVTVNTYTASFVNTEQSGNNFKNKFSQ